MLKPPETLPEPKRLLWLLKRIAAISTLVVLVLSTVGIYWLYENFVVSTAEQKSVSLSESIVALTNQQMLQGGTDSVTPQIFKKANQQQLDHILRTFLRPYDILKIKIFSLDAEIIYSTDSGIIGQLDSDNERLQHALSGANDSEIQTKDEMYDLRGEWHFDVDVVETYVPIRNEQGEVVGVFEIYQDATRYRQQIVLQVLMSLSFLAVIIVVIYAIAYSFLRVAVGQLTLTQDKLQRLATIDDLTDCLNRREIIRLGEDEYARCSRQGEKSSTRRFCLIMVDLDNFKKINDRHGHPSGDAVLRTVANRIKQQMRRYSVVGRYGGEEFTVLLPETDQSELLAVSERIRQAIEMEPIPLANKSINVTISLGATCVSDDDGSFDEVLLRADNYLYRAKENGRNRVESDI
ncbi:MAG: GGDEF domain-containing protein [Motiliproteus sp.]